MSKFPQREVSPRSQTAAQQDLEHFKKLFMARTSHGEELLKYFERSQCGVWRCEQDSADSKRWWLNITLPAMVAEMFDAHLELQVLYTEYQTVEPRLLEVVQRRIDKNPRLDNAIYVIASFDDNIKLLFRRRRGEYAGIGLNLSDIGSHSPDMRERMSEVASAVDHYDRTKPVQESNGFFGRSSEIDQIISAIRMGESTGVFGLRKTGKTSLLNTVAAKRRELAAPVVWVDISGLTSADDLRIKILETTWGALNALEQALPRMRTLSRNGEVKVGLEELRLNWLRDLESLAKASGQRLELFIDEIDQLFPERSNLDGDSARDMFVALSQLRRMIQAADEDSGAVLVCAGVDPAIFERPILPNGADNLLYKLVRLLYLAPLSRDDMAEMVRELGRRMGIRVRDHEVIDFLFSEYGGHVLLTRKACSLASRRRSGPKLPWHMGINDVTSAANSTHEGSPLRQAADILTSFNEWFPLETDILRAVWSSDSSEATAAAALCSEDPSLLTHARAYGLVEKDSLHPRIRAVARNA